MTGRPPGRERALFIGRFQPFHRGHLHALGRIRAEEPAAPILLGIGSAQESYTWENPFTAGERFEMIAEALAEAEIADVSLIPIPDIRRHDLWVRHVESLLPPFAWVYTDNPLTAELFGAAGYPVRSVGLLDRSTWVGQGIREALRQGAPVDGRVPPSVARWLREHHAADRLKVISRP
ncbi:MAG: nicotinamide-nucleotide adenylyltransferase [Thermoplasmata archaeon]